MKVKMSLLLFVLVTLVSSCKPTNESLIKDEFKKYVQSNFDNPSMIKEIASIEKVISINSDSLIEQLKSGLLEGELSKHRIDSLISIHDVNDMSHLEKPDFSDFSLAYMTLSMKAEQYKDVIENYVSNIDEKKKTDRTIYTVKYRVKVDEDLKIRNIYALIDNKTQKNKVTFSNNMPEVSGIDEYTEILELGNKYLEAVNRSTKMWLSFYGYE